MKIKIYNTIAAIAIASATISACGSSASGDTSTTASDSTSKPAAPAFSADSAFSYVADQVAFGPRVPGTDAHRACRQYITDRLTAAGAQVSFQDTIFAPAAGSPVNVHNIIGRFNPDAPRQLMLVAHYDTRPWADRDDDTSAHSTPIDGANDGASGVGVMLEIARHARSLSASTGLTLLFVDQEDSGTYDGDDLTWCVGSQAYAASLDPASRKPSFAILLDMVGGRDARFNPEYFSQRYAPAVVEHVWNTARSLGYADRFPSTPGGALNDDHIHLLGAGIPTIDIVESNNSQTGTFNPTWHTLDDNIDNIDPSTLKVVGDVITKIIFN